MPTVKGPLHSDTAIGSIGKQIAFQRTPRGYRATKYSKPGSVRKTEPTANQLAHRAQFAALVALWKTATSEDLKSWDTLAIPALTSRYAEFTRCNWQRIKDGLPPTTAYTTTPPPPPPPPINAYVTPFPNVPTPDSTGEYRETPPINGFPTYTRNSDDAFIAYYDTDAACWFISTSVGNNVTNTWENDSGPEGDYYPATPDVDGDVLFMLA